MPIHLEIFHPDRIIVAVGRGNVTVQDYAELVAKIVEAKVLHYRKIIDVADAESQEVSWDVLIKADEMMRSRTDRPRGPLALVVSRDRGEMARAFKEQSTDRPVGVFGSIHDARAWLRSQPVVD
jgi:hypothetical protein